MTHEPRLTAALRELLHTHRVAALGTQTADGAPFVSMVPYALSPATGELVIHISALAPHTRNLERQPRAALMVCQAEVPGEPVHALARVSLAVTALPCPAGSAEHAAARAAYLARFPEAEPMTTLGDFRFVRLQPGAAHQVAGFGAARSLDATDLRAAIGPAP
jgi:hypothetical protein